jgi:hypothetical protein
MIKDSSARTTSRCVAASTLANLNPSRVRSVSVRLKKSGHFEQLARLGQELIIQEGQIAGRLTVEERPFGKIHGQRNLLARQLRLSRALGGPGLGNLGLDFVAPDGE